MGLQRAWHPRPGNVARRRIWRVPLLPELELRRQILTLVVAVRMHKQTRVSMYRPRRPKKFELNIDHRRVDLVPAPALDFHRRVLGTDEINRDGTEARN